MTGPLAGVRVLDFATTFSGPYATMLLAELGAEVLKVEAPGGDITRSLGTACAPGLGSVYVGVNKNKPAVTLDLKTESGRDTVRQLIIRADCLVHNMRPAAAGRIGIDAATAMALNPRLIHATITGYGSDGPYAGRPAYDDVIQAMSGMAWLQSLNEPEPAYVATALADKVAGMYLSHSVLAALYWRAGSGVGQAVEVPMFETLTAMVLVEQWGGRAVVPPTGETGYGRMRSTHRRPFRTADGLISVVVYHDGHWARFLTALGYADLLEDPRYATTEARNRHIDDLYELLAGILRDRPTAEWLTVLADLDIPATPVRSTDQVLDDEHLRAVDFFQQVPDPGGLTYLATRSAARFTATPPADPRELPGPDPQGRGTDRLAAWLAG